MSEFVDPIDPLRELASQRSPDGIALFLAAHGVRGKKDSNCECPVARWLAESTGLAFVVERYETMLENPSTFADVWPLPAVVSEFIELFDQGEYPELEM